MYGISESQQQCEAQRVYLILFGVLGKISGALLAIPNPVLGGLTTFLFASVAVSRLRVLSYVRFTRRDRFVLAAAFIRCRRPSRTGDLHKPV
jgi:xanthine/uracil permease